MEIAVKKQPIARISIYLLISFFGAAFIALCALIKIPFYPIPFTLQTFAITFIALTQRPTQALGSTLAYLVAATAGLPVLNGGFANALWIFGPSSGYLVAFPIAAWLISYLKTRLHPLLAIFFGQILILASGFAGLASLIGLSLAWSKGVVLFLASDTLKNLGAFSLIQIWKKIKG